MAFISPHCNAHFVGSQSGFAADQKLQWALPLLKRQMRAKPASSEQYLLWSDGGAGGGNRFLPDKAEDKHPSDLDTLD